MTTRTAVVTGSTSGIGLGMARALCAAGNNVVINGFGDKDQIEADRAAMAEEFGVSVRYHPADMSKPNEIADLVSTATAEYGGVDILVNSAGIQHVEAVEDFPEEKWDAIIAINMSSAFHMIKHSVAGMKARGWGRIVNIASAHGLVASPFKSAYVTAKHGMIGLTKTVALETAEHGITCNAICPGYVLTPLVEKQIPDQARSRGISEEAVINDVLLAAQMTKQFVTVEQLSALLTFLCSDAAAQITGASLPVDGGWTAH